MPGPRTPRESYTEMNELVLPQHANHVGKAFGGTILAWMDVCGGIAAQRHCRRVAVTAALDELTFRSPIKVGDLVVLTGRVNATFRTSLEVQVEVAVEDMKDGHRKPCVEAFLTYVAIDDGGDPCPIPELVAETAEDRRRAEEAAERRARRLKSRRSLGR